MRCFKAIIYLLRTLFYSKWNKKEQNNNNKNEAKKSLTRHDFGTSKKKCSLLLFHCHEDKEEKKKKNTGENETLTDFQPNDAAPRANITFISSQARIVYDD